MGTRKLADKPTNFQAGKYLLIPSVSFESRQYIPIGYSQRDAYKKNDRVFATAYSFENFLND